MKVVVVIGTVRRSPLHHIRDTLDFFRGLACQNAAMKGWLRNGLIAGAGAGIATLVLGLLRAAAKPDYCHHGIVAFGSPADLSPSAVDIVATLSSVAVLLLAAGIAGWRTARVRRGTGKPALAGIVTGTVSGIGTLVLNLTQLDQNGQCIVRSGFAGPGTDMRPTLLIVAAVVIAIGAGFAAIVGSVGAALARRR